MRDLLNLALPVIVWIGLVLITRLMENVLKKIVRQIHRQLAQGMLSEKRLAAVIVKNAVMIVVPLVQSLIPAPMPQQLNAVTNVITAILLARQIIPVVYHLIMNADKPAKLVPRLVLLVVLHPIPEVWLVIMNAVMLAKVAQPLVLMEPQPQILVVAAAQPEMNVAQKLVIILMKDVVLTFALPVLPRLIVNPVIMLKKSAQRNVAHLVILA